jgi:hypothetical protein
MQRRCTQYLCERDVVTVEQSDSDSVTPSEPHPEAAAVDPLTNNVTESCQSIPAICRHLNNGGIRARYHSNRQVSPMRLPLIAPADLSPEQRPVYDSMRVGIEKNFQGFKTIAKNGALIGPWNPWLHEPKFGKPIWDLTLALSVSPSLPAMYGKSRSLLLARLSIRPTNFTLM